MNDVIRFFKCKDIAQLTAEAEGRHLSLRERIGMRIHFYLCKPCVNFMKQLKFMDQARTAAGEKLPEQAGINMSAEAKERIRQQLAQD